MAGRQFPKYTEYKPEQKLQQCKFSVKWHGQTSHNKSVCLNYGKTYHGHNYKKASSTVPTDMFAQTRKEAIRADLISGGQGIPCPRYTRMGGKLLTSQTNYGHVTTLGQGHGTIMARTWPQYGHLATLGVKDIASIWPNFLSLVNIHAPCVYSCRMGGEFPSCS